MERESTSFFSKSQWEFPAPIISYQGKNIRSSEKPLIYATASGYSESGYVGEPHIKQALEALSKTMRLIHGEKKPIILLADNLRPHRTVDILEFAMEHHLMLQMFCLNASHFLQPLNEQIFAIFKDSLLKNALELRSSSQLLGIYLKHEVAVCISNAVNSAFRPSKIRDAW